MTRIAIVTGVAIMTVNASAGAEERQYTFDVSMPRPVLESYLSRAITMMDLLNGRGDVDDNVRMLTECGVKFAGRTLYMWGGEQHLPVKLHRASVIAPKLHAADPEMVLQAGIFEIVTTQVGEIAVPEWVFEEFDLTPEQRSFDYEAMLFQTGKFKDHWNTGASVPDMTQLETRMWFYFLAKQYIDAGCEAIHFGQVALIGATDEGHKHWWDMLSRVRRYAKEHARRHFILCDAHTPHGGPRYDGDKLLFDFHSFPLRIKDIPDKPQEGVLEMGYLDTLFGRSNGGITPSGWTCDHLPYLVEFDNWGSSGKGGQGGLKYWTWGYDEICWFARQPEDYRNTWLRYAWDWVREHDPNGFLQMPGSRCLADPVVKDDGEQLWWYYANRPSAAVPDGYGQEDAIKAIWAGDEGE
jgi:hypothetical protein